MRANLNWIKTRLPLKPLGAAAFLALLLVGAPGMRPAGAVVQPPGAKRPPTGAAGPARLIVKLEPGADQALVRVAHPATGALDVTAALGAHPTAATLLRTTGARAIAPLHRGRLLERLNKGISDGDIAVAARQRFPLRAARAPQGAVIPDLGGSYVLDLGTRSADEVQRVLAAVRRQPGVVYAEEDALVKAAYNPNDPSFAASGSWGQPYDDLYGPKRIGAPQAWDTQRGAGVVVAVVDTGVDYNHPDINDNVWLNSREIPGNGVDDDHNGFVDDVRGWDFVGASADQITPDNDPADHEGHGTHVAGTVAAEGDNSLGVVGVAWKSRIMAIKALDDAGQGPDSSIAGAIIYAADQGADIINASWSGPESQAIADAVNYAYGLGVVVVAAAGNDTADTNRFSPSKLPASIVVASLSPFDGASYFTNYGNKLDVAAPGEDILSLQAGTGGYVRLSGTSMAAPHVSGVAALILSHNPSFTNEQVRQILRTTATDLGSAGRDIVFGYGRVDAARSVLVSSALEAKVLGPADGDVVNVASPAVTITAKGPGFARYTLELGRGASPSSWSTLASGTTAVSRSAVATVNTATTPDGLYTLRLRAFDGAGKVYDDNVQFQVRFLAITSPATPPTPARTIERKPGTVVDVIGTARGPSFQSYRLEWAPGAGATTGFSTSGMVLTGNGSAPVQDDLLGRWTTPATLAGDYTIRLVVNDTGFSSEATTIVYMEPALASSAWPLLVGPANYEDAVMPARRPDGSPRFVLCGSRNSGAPCRSYAPDGTFTEGPLQSSADFQPAIGNLDGQPGDEVVAADGGSLKVFSADLTPSLVISTGRPERFGVEPVSLADLDNDGIPEILAVAHGTAVPSASLHVYRANGQPFSSRYPLAITSPLTPAGVNETRVMAVDLDGDGRKELVVTVVDLSGSQFTLQAFNGDGTARSGWPNPSFPSRFVYGMAAADLDHDGKNEIILAESSSGSTLIRVVSNTGAVRSGWPVNLGSATSTYLAIGDLDRDQRDEIVVGHGLGLFALRPDGSALPGFPRAGIFSAPVIADLDNDTFPEVLVGTFTGSGQGNVSRDVTLMAFRKDGSTLRQWRILGVANRQVGFVTPSVGDFNGDGKVDIVANLGLIEGGGASGLLINSGMTYLEAGTTFNAAGADWPLTFHDPQNSGVRPGSDLRLAPRADAYVRDGSAASTNFGSASLLQVKTDTATGNNRDAYFRFDTSAASKITRATLRVYAALNGSGSVATTVHAVSSTSWSEGGITWNNKPARGAALASVTVSSTTGRFFDLDVTSYVKSERSAGRNLVSFALHDGAKSSPYIAVNSKEASSNRPELVIQ
jgi:subtilisin family serine protease